MEPTPEQSAAVAAFQTGSHLALQAGAGTGKTTTLAMLAASTDWRGVYIAFSRDIAHHAARTFPSNVTCGTAHAIAWHALGRRYERRMNGPRIKGWKVGVGLGIGPHMWIRLGERRVTHKALSNCVLKTVTRFCHSADRAIEWHHVPRLRGVEGEDQHAQLVDVVLPYARKAWIDLQNPDAGIVRFEHDHYLKMWALTEPVIRGDFLLLDEAQDTNPVLEEVFTGQRGRAQLVMVGDSAQAIYGWRGARDVMSGFDAPQLTLSQSFRFGPALADEANRWLRIVDAPIRLTGSGSIETKLTKIKDPRAILCRTNVGAMVEVMALLDAKRRVALAGGGRDGDLQDYAEWDPSGHDLLPLVELVDEHGVDVILDAVARLADEERAEVTVSTAHRAKGREWSTVRIANDFSAPEAEEDDKGEPRPGRINPAEARLAYVAVTRARHRLDLGGLSWINEHPDGASASRSSLR